jgi:DNA-binding transcriptional LysR family regulator
VCRVFTANGLEPPRSLVRSDSIGLAKALLPLEDFIALLSPESVDVELAQSTLVALEAPQVAEQRVAAITTRARSSLQPAARELIALVREECMRLYGPP